MLVEYNLSDYKSSFADLPALTEVTYTQVVELESMCEENQTAAPLTDTVTHP